MRARLLLCIGIALAACTSACSSPGGNGSTDMSVQVLADLALPPYPPGPYGNQINDTFPPLLWEGYAADKADVVVSTRPYGSYGIDDARRASSQKRYGFVHVSDFI